MDAQFSNDKALPFKIQELGQDANQAVVIVTPAAGDTLAITTSDPNISIQLDAVPTDPTALATGYLFAPDGYVTPTPAMVTAQANRLDGTQIGLAEVLNVTVTAVEVITVADAIAFNISDPILKSAVPPAPIPPAGAVQASAKTAAVKAAAAPATPITFPFMMHHSDGRSAEAKNAAQIDQLKKLGFSTSVPAK